MHKALKCPITHLKRADAPTTPQVVFIRQYVIILQDAFKIRWDFSGSLSAYLCRQKNSENWQC